MNLTISPQEVFGSLKIFGMKLSNANQASKVKEKKTQVAFEIPADAFFGIIKDFTKVLRDGQDAFMSFDKTTATKMLNQIGPIEDTYNRFMDSVDGLEIDTIESHRRIGIVMELLQVLTKIKDDCEIVAFGGEVDEFSEDFNDWLSREIVKELQCENHDEEKLYSNAKSLFAEL